MPYYHAKLNGEDRLIKAKTIAGARNHLIKPLAPEVTALDTDGVAELMGKGVRLEDASASEAEPAVVEVPAEAPVEVEPKHEGAEHHAKKGADK